MIRVGLAGCGWAGARHADAIKHDSRASLVAIADIDEDVRNRCASEWNVDDVYAGYDAMISEASLDAVVVALPHHLHEDAVIRGAEAGVDILVEKPIGRTLHEADRMLDAATSAGVQLIVAESARYEPWVVAVERVLAEGVVGRPAFAEYHNLHDYGGAYRYDRSEWLNDPEKLGGGPWLLNGVHAVSAIRGWFDVAGCGAIDRVFAREFRTPSFRSPEGMEASVAATFGFESGATVLLTLGVETPHFDRYNDVRIHGTEGTVRVGHTRSRMVIHRIDEEPREVSLPSDTDPFVPQLAAFIDGIDQGAPSRTSGARERDTLAVIRAGYRSMERDEVISPSYRSS